MLPQGLRASPEAPPDRAFITAAVRSATMWRLLALFVAANGVPLIVSAWLVTFLTRDVGVRTGLGGRWPSCCSA